MPFTVYAMTNTDDTHIYVGSTKNYRLRCGRHMNDCKHNRHSNRHVQALYNQIGPDGFEFDAVKEFDTKAEARAAEQRWVDYYLAAPEWQLLNIATNDVNQPSCNPEVTAKSRPSIAAAMSKPVYVKWQDGREAKYSSKGDAAVAVGVSKRIIGDWCLGKSITYTKPKYGIKEIRYL
jgi:predicted GIY-YIG superfamily endonuclease